MAKRYLLSVSLLSSNGSALASSMSTFDTIEEATMAAREAQDSINNVLKDGFIYVPSDGQNGMVEPLFSVQEFFSRFLKARRFACTVTEVEHDGMDSEGPRIQTH